MLVIRCCVRFGGPLQASAIWFCRLVREGAVPTDLGLAPPRPDDLPSPHRYARLLSHLTLAQPLFFPFPHACPTPLLPVPWLIAGMPTSTPSQYSLAALSHCHPAASSALSRLAAHRIMKFSARTALRRARPGGGWLQSTRHGRQQRPRPAAGRSPSQPRSRSRPPPPCTLVARTACWSQPGGWVGQGCHWGTSALFWVGGLLL